MAILSRSPTPLDYIHCASTGQQRMIENKEIFGPSSLGTAAFVDDFTIDAAGNIWVTTVLRNGVGIITPSGDYHVVFEDARTEQLESFEAKLAAGEAQPLDMLMAAGTTLQLLTSITFGGPDLRTVYIGSLGMNHLPTFRSPVPGLPMSHWR